MYEKNVKIKNRAGVHARPASSLVKIAGRFDSDIFISKGGDEINGKSIMGVLSLGIVYNSEITIKAIGHDEEKAVDTLVKLIEDRFAE